MAKRKKKQLPKDFDVLLKQADIETLKEIFDDCDINATGGLFKEVALAFNTCPDELSRWLVEQGADICAKNEKGQTPLHRRAGWRHGNLKILIDLGAEVNDRDKNFETPLHKAANAYSVDNVKLLIDNGADVNALNIEGLIPLESAMRYCRPASIADMTDIAELLLAAGSLKTSRMREYMEEIGNAFEFVRPHFNPESLNSTDDALNRLYKLMEVKPIPKRKMQNLNELIEINSKGWEDQYDELWEKLVPGAGTAETVQGEVIRIAGRMADEFLRNGGSNWDKDYKKMADTFSQLLQTGQPLADDELDETKILVQEIKMRNVDTSLFDRISQLAVKWVLLNLQPIKYDTPSYKR